MLGIPQCMAVNKCVGNVSAVKISNEGDHLIVGGMEGGIMVMKMNPNKSYKTRTSGSLFTKDVDFDTGEIINPKIIGIRLLNPTRRILPFIVASEKSMKVVKVTEGRKLSGDKMYISYSYNLINNMEPFRTIDVDERTILSSNYSNIFIWDIEYYRSHRYIQMLDGFGCKNYYGLIYTTASYFGDMIFYGSTTGQVFYGKKSDPWMSLEITVPSVGDISDTLMRRTGRQISDIYYNDKTSSLIIRTPYHIITYDIRSIGKPLSTILTIPEELVKEVNINGYNKKYSMCGCDEYICTEGCTRNSFPVFHTYSNRLTMRREYLLSQKTIKRKSPPILEPVLSNSQNSFGTRTPKEYGPNFQICELDCTKNGDKCVCGWDKNIVVFNRIDS